MKRNYSENNYTDGRYPSIKAPEESLWEEDFFDDDDEDSWESWTRPMKSGPAQRSAEQLGIRERQTTRRRVKSQEQAVNYEHNARSWRSEEPVRTRQHIQEDEDLTLDANGPRMPLSIALLVTTILLTIVGGVGRMHGYQNLSYDWKTSPLLSLVFDGWHSKINPIAALTQDPETPEILEEAAAIETADEATTEEVVEEVDLTIPDGINDPVVQAMDYGICDSRLLAPAGTVWETATSGIYAPNGTYYEPQAVDESYFGDALFVGDSRTDGLRIYGDMSQYTDFWCKDGMNVEVILTDMASYYTPSMGINASEQTLEQTLAQKTYRKVYVCVGINELGIPDTVKFYNLYRQLISYIRESQPNAIIYIQGIMHVTASYSQTDPTYNNTNIVEKNTAIASLANGRDIIYLDMNDRVTDENGDLIAELSGDGVHLKASAYAYWKEDLLSHAIVRDAADWATLSATSDGSVTGDGTTTNLEGGTGKPESDISDVTGFVVQ